VFTGLIEEIGEVTNLRETPEGRRIRIRGPRTRVGTAPGDSLCVNGVCQTVVSLVGPDSVEVVAVAETLRRTTFGGLRTGARVNLERALRLGDRLGGHVVNGHVDGTSTILEIRPSGRERGCTISFPAALARYIAEKGSIAVDGVSLTVGLVEERGFHVHIIPETWERTRFAEYRLGDSVNLEVDVLAKYVERAVHMTREGASPAPGSSGADRAFESWVAEAWKEEPGV
jgi:riboflavin synthase